MEDDRLLLIVFLIFISVTKICSITDLVIGKNVSLPWHKKIFREPIEDKLFEELKQTEIHLLPYNKKEITTKKSPFKLITHVFEGSKFKDFSLMLFLMVLTTFVSSALIGSGFGDQNIIILYLLTIILVARFTTGYFWSGLSSFLSVIFLIGFCGAVVFIDNVQRRVSFYVVDDVYSGTDS